MQWVELKRYKMNTNGVSKLDSQKTELIKDNEALRKENKLLETTLSSVGDGVISCDRDGHVLFINRVAEDLTGWSKKEALGKPIEKIFNIIDEDSQEKVARIIADAIDIRAIQPMDNHTLLIARDGSKRPIEESAAPIIAENDEVLGLVLVFRDYTEKKTKTRTNCLFKLS